jgi:hypothetical protein
MQGRRGRLGTPVAVARRRTPEDAEGHARPWRRRLETRRPDRRAKPAGGWAPGVGPGYDAPIGRSRGTREPSCARDAGFMTGATPRARTHATEARGGRPGSARRSRAVRGRVRTPGRGTKPRAVAVGVRERPFPAIAGPPCYSDTARERGQSPGAAAIRPPPARRVMFRRRHATHAHTRSRCAEDGAKRQVGPAAPTRRDVPPARGSKTAKGVHRIPRALPAGG